MGIFQRLLTFLTHSTDWEMHVPSLPRSFAANPHMKNPKTLSMPTLAPVGHTGVIRYKPCVANKHMLRGKKKVKVSPVNVPSVSCHSIYWMSRDRRWASRNFMYLLFLFLFMLWMTRKHETSVPSWSRKWNAIQITWDWGANGAHAHRVSDEEYCKQFAVNSELSVFGRKKIHCGVDICYIFFTALSTLETWTDLVLRK